ncbi:MAG: hypothetical protein ACYTXT_28590 [Nostoc sp.]|uniref:hypothetical protein n=1 Tax=Nostoc sp. JL23 TaxID=2815394 RepID=UPI001DCB3C0C|nr:hypothetical protein [Nostoc sp. JL23]MBN3877052.1 hypothetical protein [Nostoc sp. JL23]
MSISSPSNIASAIQVGSIASKALQKIAPIVSEAFIESIEVEQKQKYKSNKG